MMITHRYVYKVSKIAEKKERERAGFFGAHFPVFFLTL